MKKRITESRLRAIVAESVRKVLKESMGEADFKAALQEDFYETLKNLFEEEAVKYCQDEAYGPEVFDEYVEEEASSLAEKWTDKSMEILNGDNWNIPQNNFRPLDFVMNEMGIHNFQELLARPNPVEIYTDWFWSAFGTYGVVYNFSNFLDEIAYGWEQEEKEGM